MTAGRHDEFPVVWQGSASQWECDHMGHLNTRYYIKRLGEGLQVFAALLAVPATLALRAVQVNARFLAEVHVPQPLRLCMGLVSEERDNLLLRAELRAVGEDRLFASFMLRAGLLDAGSGERQLLPETIIALARRFRVSVDENLSPRSYDVAAWSPEAVTGPERPTVGVGAFTADSVDAHGIMRMEEPIARLADCMGGLMIPYRAPVIEHANPRPDKPGGAMLETRIDIVRWPRAGEAFRLDAALIGAGSKTLEIESRMTGLGDGGLIARMRCVTIVFDLDRRRAVAIAPAAAEVLRTMLAN